MRRAGSPTTGGLRPASRPPPCCGHCRCWRPRAARRGRRQAGARRRASFRCSPSVARPAGRCPPVSSPSGGGGARGRFGVRIVFVVGAVARARRRARWVKEAPFVWGRRSGTDGFTRNAECCADRRCRDFMLLWQICPYLKIFLCAMNPVFSQIFRTCAVDSFQY